MSKKPSYRITVKSNGDMWKVSHYVLKLTPIYEYGKPQTEPVRVEESWELLDYEYALFYLEARFMAWKLQRSLERGKFFNGEEIIYERKGQTIGKS